MHRASWRAEVTLLSYRNCRHASLRRRHQKGAPRTWEFDVNLRESYGSWVSQTVAPIFSAWNTAAVPYTKQSGVLFLGEINKPGDWWSCTNAKLIKQYAKLEVFGYALRVCVCLWTYVNADVTIKHLQWNSPVRHQTWKHSPVGTFRPHFTLLLLIAHVTVPPGNSLAGCGLMVT